MTKGTSTAFIAAIAASSVSAAFQLSTVIWADWIKNHVPITIALWIFAGLMWTWWVVARFILSPAEVQTLTSGSNISSPSVHAPINFAPVINVGNIEQSKSVESPARAPSELGSPTQSPAVPSKLSINYAEYSGVDGSGEKYNVTDCLRLMIVDDRLVLDVENHSFHVRGHNYVPKDPKPYVKKKLYVAYSYAGGPLQSVEKLEGSRLEIPEIIRTPRLVLRREWREVIFDISPGIWRLLQSHEVGGSLMLMLWVENPYPQTKGAKGTNFSNLVAHIKVQHFGTIQIPRAYWLDLSNNQIDLGSGFERAVIVGQFSGQDFVIYENPFAYTGDYVFDMPVRPLGQEQRIRVSDRDKAVIEIHVSIVNSASNVVLERRRISIHLPQRITEMTGDDA